MPSTMMRSTMMDFPLTVGHIFEHGRTLYADSVVVTNEAGGVRRIEFGALADRADQLAAALRRLGVAPGDRVATFGWNNSQHQEAYFAIPGMGAVMHTINIRLSAEQIRYIIGHAEDSVLIADASLAPVLGPVLADGRPRTLRHLIVYGDGDRSALPEAIDYEELLAAERPGFAWPETDERSAAAMCYTSGTTGLPKGVVYSHRSTRGGCRTPPGWSAPTCCCRTGSRRPRRWPGSSRRNGPPWPRPCPRCGTTSSGWTAWTCPRCG